MSRVDLYIDGSFYASDTSSPFTFAWNTAGYSARSSPITITVGQADSTPPDVQVTSVASDKKNLTITVSASDAQGRVTKVEFYVDGKLKATDTTNPWSVKISAKSIGGGTHSVQAHLYDTAGNVGILRIRCRDYAISNIRY